MPRYQFFGYFFSFQNGFSLWKAIHLFYNIEYIIAYICRCIMSFHGFYILRQYIFCFLSNAFLFFFILYAVILEAYLIFFSILHFQKVSIFFNYCIVWTNSFDCWISFSFPSLSLSLSFNQSLSLWFSLSHSLKSLSFLFNVWSLVSTIANIFHSFYFAFSNVFFFLLYLFLR